MTVHMLESTVSMINTYRMNPAAAELTHYLVCDEEGGGCGKIHKDTDPALRDETTCCCWYSYHLHYTPALAYGGPEITGWTAISKPVNMMLKDLSYVLGMGKVPYKLERRVVKSIHRDGKPHVTIMVPKYLKGRAEWLIHEWRMSEWYYATTARKALVDMLVSKVVAVAGDLGSLSAEITHNGFRVTYIHPCVRVYDDLNELELIATIYIKERQHG